MLMICVPTVAMLLNMLMYKLNKTPLVGMGYGWAFAAMSFAVSYKPVLYNYVTV